ncbi:MAG: LppX_LprAFG lipoprotein [Anaerolineae bacterium]
MWRIAITFALMAFIIACRLSLPSTQVVTPTPFPTLTLTPTEPGISVGTPATRLSARDVIRQAAARMAEVETFHFSVQLGGSKPDIGALLNWPVPVLLTGVEGDVVRPDQLHARVTVTILGASAHLDLVCSQGQMYLSNPLTGKWEKISAEVSQSFSPSVLFSPEQGLPDLLTALEWRMVGFDEVQGVSVYHLQARDVPGIDVTGSGEGSEAMIDIWIGMQTFLLYQVQIDERSAGSEKVNSWLLTLSAFDRPVVITPPVVQ